MKEANGGQESDYDECHTLNHMFLLKLSDRAKEDLWAGEISEYTPAPPPPPALTWMCLGTVSTNSNTAGLLWEIHLPSLGMPKWLWRCNSLILGSEQCSLYCYGKSMWLSWRAASAAEQSSNSGVRRRTEVKDWMKKKGKKGHKDIVFAVQVFFWQSVNENDKDVSLESSSPQLSQINECGRNLLAGIWQQCVSDAGIPHTDGMCFSRLPFWRNWMDARLIIQMSHREMEKQTVDFFLVSVQTRR